MKLRKLKIAAMTVGLVSSSESLVILNENVIVPVYSGISTIQIPIFNENIIQISDILNSSAIPEIFLKKFSGSYLNHDCPSPFTLPIEGSFEKCYDIETVNINRHSFCEDQYVKENRNSLIEVRESDVASFSPSLTSNFKIVKSFLKTLFVQEGLTFRLIIKLTSNEIQGVTLFCDTPTIMLNFDDVDVKMDETNLIPISVKNKIEIVDSFSKCKSFKCDVGFTDLFNFYKKTSSNEIISRFKASSRFKREIQCSGFTLWGVLGIGYNSCENGVSLRDISDQKNFLENEINDFKMAVATKMDILSFTLIETETKINEMINKLSDTTKMLNDEINMIKHTFTFSELKQSMVTKEMKSIMRIDNIVLNTLNSADRLFKDMKDHMMIIIWLNTCLTSSNCQEINHYISTKITHWDELIKHNFNPHLHLVFDKGEAFLQFQSPENVEFTLMMLPTLPEIQINQGCSSLENGLFHCEKCYHQKQRYLTLNINGTNNHVLSNTEPTITLDRLDFVEGCVTDSDDKSKTIQIGSKYCLMIGDNELQMVRMSICENDTIETIHTVKMITNLKTLNVLDDMKFNENLNILDSVHDYHSTRMDNLNFTFKLKSLVWDDSKGYDLINNSKPIFKSVTTLFLTIVLTNTLITVIFISRKTLISLSLKLYHSFVKCLRKKEGTTYKEVFRKKLIKPRDQLKRRSSPEFESIEMIQPNLESDLKFRPNAPSRSRSMNNCRIEFDYVDERSGSTKHLVLVRPSEDYFFKFGENLTVKSSEPFETDSVFNHVSNYVLHQ